MTRDPSSSSKPYPNVPSPPGSKAGNTYARFIPREELGAFANWQPGAIDGTAHERRAQPRPEGAPLPTPDEWRTRIAEARSAGYQDGYRDGLVGLESFKQSHAVQVSAQIGKLLTSFDSELAALESQMAHAVARTAVLLAQRVVRQELKTRPENIVHLAEEAVHAVLLSARRILLRVHPDDLPLVQHGAAEVIAARGARVVGDTSVQRGGCVVESDAGAIDASVATRWANAAAAMGSDVEWLAPERLS